MILIKRSVEVVLEGGKFENMSNKLLEIKDLYVNADSKEILKGINLKLNKGEIHVIMGPNGSRENHYCKCNIK